jgi:hypothetical protein
MYIANEWDRRLKGGMMSFIVGLPSRQLSAVTQN